MFGGVAALHAAGVHVGRSASRRGFGRSESNMSFDISSLRKIRYAVPIRCGGVRCLRDKNVAPEARETARVPRRF